MPRVLSGKLIWYVLAIVMALFFVTPIALYYAKAFDDGAHGLVGMTKIQGIGEILFNTVVLAAGSTVVATVIAVILAKAVLHVPRRLRGVAQVIPVLMLCAPPVAVVIGWAFVFAPTVGYGNVLLRQLPIFSGLSEGPLNVYSMPAITLITGFDLTGVVFLLVYARLMEIRGPLEAAARLAGATGVKCFFTITLPLLRPALAAGAGLCFLLGLGQFTAPLLLGSRHGIFVLTTEIFSLRAEFPVDYATTAALGLPLLVLGVVVLVAQRLGVGDQRKYVTHTGGSGGVTEKTSVWAMIAVTVYTFVAVALPLGAIILVAFSPFWSGQVSGIDWTTHNIVNGLNDATIISSIVTTFQTSITAILIAIPITFVAALATSGPFRAPRPVQYILDATFQSSLSVPRAVLGLAILYVFIRPPFSLYGTTSLFVIGYLFVILPFMLRGQQGSLIGLSPSLFEAARISGAGYLRAVVGIGLPLVRRGIAAGATLGMVLLSHDFAVSVMVRSPGTNVMGTKLYDLWENGIYPQVAVMSLIMTAVTAAMLMLAIGIGGRSALRNL